MPNTVGKNLNLNLCFTKIKLPLLFFSQSPTISTTPAPPNPEDQSRPLPASSLIFRNFNSLYEDAQLEEDYIMTTSNSSTLSAAAAAAVSDADDDASAAADFSTVYASRRFFFSTPGRSNSIVDSAGERHGGCAADVTLFGNSVAVPTFSPDPYADFRRSMQEMLEASRDPAVTSSDNNNNWEFLHELLMCYLALNPKSTHKFIIGAFSDLVVSLMPSLPDGDSLRENGIADVCEIPTGR